MVPWSILHSCNGVVNVLQVGFFVFHFNDNEPFGIFLASVTFEFTSSELLPFFTSYTLSISCLTNQLNNTLSEFLFNILKLAVRELAHNLQVVGSSPVTDKCVNNYMV